MYTILSFACIAVLCSIAIGCIVAIVRRKPSEQIDFIRKFKKGNCAIVYLASIPLYWIGHIYGGQDILPAFFSAINKTMTLVVLRYDMSSISALMEADIVYTVAVYFCFILVTFNAMMFALSFLHQKIWAWWQTVQWNLSNKEKLLIIGNNPENIKIYSSECERAVMLLDDISDDAQAKLFAKGISYISKRSDISSAYKNGDDTLPDFNEIERYCCDLLRECLSNPTRSAIIVINTKDEDKNIALCHKIISSTKSFFKNKDTSAIADLLTRIKVYVYGLPAHETIYNSIVESSNGCIHYINKYRQIALDFVDKYPLTQFMTKREIDYTTSLLQPGVDVNFAMIGFGKTNQEIFLTSVANNQFLAEIKGKIDLKPVHYLLFDRKYEENSKNLNHSFYRYKNEFSDEIKEQEKGIINQSYLPFPALPADVIYDKLDVNDSGFYKKIRRALSGDSKFNYIVIGFGTDLENIDMAHKMLEKKQEWGLNNTYIFVKVRNGDDSHAIFDRDDCFMIGDEPRSVYNIKKIDDDAITAMAKLRNRIYALEYEVTPSPNKMTNKSIDDIYKKADCDWFIKKTQFERESNLYACLSLRSKLHMMGLDYAPLADIPNGAALSNEVYKNCYAPDDLPQPYPDLSAEGKPVIKYGLDFKDSRRKTMAIHEHFRWNSFMLSKGFVPASKEDILNDKERNGRNYHLRRHGNLTTFEGLVEFREMIAKRDGVDPIETDVIKYDYQLLDDAYWLLDKSRCGIISKDQ